VGHVHQHDRGAGAIRLLQRQIDRPGHPQSRFKDRLELLTLRRVIRRGIDKVVGTGAHGLGFSLFDWLHLERL
jgi:hypothetical protein